MGQKKLIRFEAIRHFDNVLEYPKDMPGQWKQFFKNEHPITLELACGKGEYAVGLGRLYPSRNFIGIDIKGNRIWREPGEVAEIWITFPDPQLRASRAKKRLTHPRFLRLYQRFLQSNGLVHLKTDSPDLYEFTLTVINLFGLEVIDQSGDVYANTDIKQELQIKTHYEGLDIAQSNRIHYLCFRLNKELPVEKDEALKQLIGEQATD